jgi:hypothetical protein
MWVRIFGFETVTKVGCVVFEAVPGWGTHASFSCFVAENFPWARSHSGSQHRKHKELFVLKQICGIRIFPFLLENSGL